MIIKKNFWNYKIMRVYFFEPYTLCEYIQKLILAYLLTIIIFLALLITTAGSIYLIGTIFAGWTNIFTLKPFTFTQMLLSIGEIYSVLLIGTFLTMFVIKWKLKYKLNSYIQSNVVIQYIKDQRIKFCQLVKFK